MDDKCIFVSKHKQWAFQDNDETINYANEACEELGLNLAKLTSQRQKIVVKEFGSE